MSENRDEYNVRERYNVQTTNVWKMREHAEMRMVCNAEVIFWMCGSYWWVYGYIVGGSVMRSFVV